MQRSAFSTRHSPLATRHWACAGFVLLCASHAHASDVLAARTELHASYAQKLDKLAAWCETENLAEEAASVRSWLPARDSARLIVFKLPETLEASSELAPKQAEWWQRFAELRKAQGEALFKLATQAAGERRGALALELANEAVRENPDHERGRAVLGYTRHGSRWVTFESARKLDGGQLRHDQFGWLPASHVKRYDDGQRYFNRRWISAEEETQRRAEITSGWRVEGDHFTVITNDSLEAGVALADKLDRLHAVWSIVFADYYGKPAGLVKAFADGLPAVSRSKTHQTVLFRNRDEYNRQLLPSEPRIAGTLGMYFNSSRKSYFFSGEGAYDGNLFHEATHQLFQETRPVKRDVGQRSNFWIIEGIACYMESLADQGDYYTLGGFEQDRIAAATHRLLKDDFYVPLAELVTYGMTDLQRDERLPMIYSQSTGLTLFLMHYEAGRYREALMGYLDAVYAGKATPQTLSKLTGVSYEELDRQYREFIVAAAGKVDSE